jgi:hypothetical protein
MNVKRFCRSFPCATGNAYGDPYNFLVYSVVRRKFAYFKPVRPSDGASACA